MIHAILHFFGIDTQQSYWYDFWSGIATQATLMFAGIGLYRKHNCRSRWCPRLGHYALKDGELVLKLCWKHHPDVPRKHLRPKHIYEIWNRQKGESEPTT